MPSSRFVANQSYAAGLMLLFACAALQPSLLISQLCNFPGLCCYASLLLQYCVDNIVLLCFKVANLARKGSSSTSTWKCTASARDMRYARVGVGAGV